MYTLGQRRDKIVREVRIWAKASDSPFMVQYKASWTENHNITFDRTSGDMDYGTRNESTSNSVCETNESPLSGYILYIQIILINVDLA